MLEIGSHCGFFLRYAKEQGWTAKGVEPAPSCVRFAREVNGIDSIHQGYYGPDCFSGERFDVVAMFDVLEHISEPVEVLSTAWRHLREGGLAICKVPHVGFYLAWHRKVTTLGRLGILPRYPTRLKEPREEDRVSKLAGFFDLFEHVVHYDEEAVRVVFGNAGFTSTRVLPAPPTNPPHDPLNLPRTVVHGAALLMHRMGRKPGRWTHGLIVLASSAPESV